MKKRTALIVFLAITGMAHADVITVSNLGTPTNGVEFVFDDGATRPQYIGNRFTTGSDANYAIDSVTLSLDTHAVTIGDFQLRLFTDNGSFAPGTQQAVFNGPAKPAENTEVTYTLGSSFSIDANTSYWLIAMGTNGEADYGWRYTEAAETSSVGWTIDEAALINDDFTIDSPSFASSQMFRINATSQIPEPATLSLILAVGGGLFFINRRLP